MTDEPADDDAAEDVVAWVEPAAQVASNLLTALASGVGGVTAGAVAAGASPLVSQAFETLGRRHIVQQRRSGEAVLEEASIASGLAPDELEQAIGADPSRLLLAGSALDAGCRTVYPNKIRALGRALAAGVTDDALVDPEHLAVAALADMEAPHVKVLRIVAEVEPPHRRWTKPLLANEHPEVEDVLVPVLATLVRHGLVDVEERIDEAMQQRDREQLRKDRFRRRLQGDSTSIADELGIGRRSVSLRRLDPYYVATEFGGHIIDLLREAADVEPDGSSATG